MINEFLITPFAEFLFMQRALLGCIILAISSCPIGIFLMLQRMSLVGDAISHTILPGVALGFLLYGFQILPMAIGGLFAGIVAVLGASIVSHYSLQKEDTSMAAFYIISLAVGVLMLSIRGSNIDLMHILFGSVLSIDRQMLFFITFVAFLTLSILCIFWRALVAQCLDPIFFRSVSSSGKFIHLLFLSLAVLNLMAGFQAMGSILSIGLMTLPAAATRFWSKRILHMCFLAVIFGILSSLGGLFLSYYIALPSGPSIVVFAGCIYCLSLFFGPFGFMQSFKTPKKHRTA